MIIIINHDSSVTNKIIIKRFYYMTSTIEFFLYNRPLMVYLNKFYSIWKEGIFILVYRVYLSFFYSNRIVKWTNYLFYLYIILIIYIYN